VLELQDGIRTNSQVRVQDDINMHNQEKKVVNTNQMEVVRQTQYEQLQTQVLHGPQPLGGGTTPLPIIYSMPFYGDYIQMSLFPGTSKWAFISFSNQICFENDRKISYSPQKYLSKDV